MMTDSPFVSWLEIWRTFAGPFLLWWMLVCGLLVLLAETAHRFITDRHVALQAFLWKITTFLLLLLPLSYLLVPSHTNISMNSLCRSFTKSEVDYSTALKGNLYEQWNTKARTRLSKNMQPLGIFENKLEMPTLPTLYRNLPGYKLDNAASKSQRNETLSFYAAWITGCIYLLGILIITAGTIIKQIQARSFLSKIRICDSPSIIESVSRIGQEMGLHQTVRIFVCEERTSPAAAGLFKPALILPSFMVKEWRNEELESILYHELTHFRSMDSFYVYATDLLHVLLWFLPFIYWHRKRSDETREALSDAQAIKKSRTAREYARLMLRLAEEIVPVSSPAHLYFFTKHGERVLRRFSRILTLDKNIKTKCTWKSRLLITMIPLVLFFYLGGLRISASVNNEAAPPGTAAYNPQTDEYRLEGAEEYFVYSKLKGSFTMSAKIKVSSSDNQYVDGFAHIGVFSDFSSDGITYAAGLRVDQYVGAWQGKVTLDQRIPDGFIRGGLAHDDLQDGWVKIVRDGNVFETYYFNHIINNWFLHDRMYLEMDDPVYVGIGVWSGDLSRSIVGCFSDVKLISQNN